MTDAVVQALAEKIADYWTLQKINSAVNRSQLLDGSPILPAGNPLVDCEWFSHFKRQELRKMGFDGQLLDVGTENAEPGKANHRVLIVGDWVLDNRRKNPYKRSTFSRMGYTEYPDRPETPK